MKSLNPAPETTAPGSQSAPETSKKSDAPEDMSSGAGANAGADPGTARIPDAPNESGAEVDPVLQECFTNDKIYAELSDAVKEKLKEHRDCLVFRYGYGKSLGWAAPVHSARFMYSNTVYRLDEADMAMKGALPGTHKTKLTVADATLLRNHSITPYSSMSERCRYFLRKFGDSLEVWSGGNEWFKLAVPKKDAGDFMGTYAYRVDANVLSKALAAAMSKGRAAPEKTESAQSTPSTPSTPGVLYRIDRGDFGTAGSATPPTYATLPEPTLFAVIKFAAGLVPTEKDAKLDSASLVCTRATMKDAEDAAAYYGSWGIEQAPNAKGSRMGICELVKIVIPVCVDPETSAPDTGSTGKVSG